MVDGVCELQCHLNDFDIIDIEFTKMWSSFSGRCISVLNITVSSCVCQIASVILLVLCQIAVRQVVTSR